MKMVKANRNLRLLVVEDNPGDYLLLKQKLQRAGVAIEAIYKAERFEEVEKILKDRQVDLAFLDLTLPDSTGIDSFKKLNDILPNIPIIVLSGLVDMELALETIALGAQDYLIKGEFDEKLLAKSIQYSIERKKTLEKLKESNARFTYVTQATFDAVWDCNLVRNELYWAESFKTIFGYASGEETDNFNLRLEMLHPEDKERVTERLNEVIEGDEINWAEEYRFKKADGQYAFVMDKAVLLRNQEGKAYRMIGAMQDISRQKEEEQTLKLFQSIIVNANDGVVITDANLIDYYGPRIVYVNEAMTRITGFTKEELTGNSARILQGLESSIKSINRLCVCLRKKETCELEILCYKKNKEEFWMNFSVVPITDEKGKLTNWISIIRDVTERKNYTKAVEEQNIKLREIAWMQSHVVREPLARIMGLVNAMNDCKSMKIGQGELLSHIVNSAHELDGVIREIVSKARAIELAAEV